MKTLIITYAVLYVTPDGSVYSKNGYDRYLERFDEIDVLARTKKVSEEQITGYIRCDSDRVSVIQFPVTGKYLLRFAEVISALYKVIEEHEYAVIEAPSVFTTIAENVAYKNKMPYVLVVKEDPDRKYRDNITGRAFKNQFRMTCLRANAVIYEKDIENEYPSYVDNYGTDERHIDSKEQDICRKFVTMAEKEYTKRTEKVVRKQRKQGH